jgi:DNA repair protein RadC
MPPPAIRPTASEAPEGPRERLRRRGREGLGDAELLAIVLGTGTASLPVELLAARVLAATGGLRGLGVRGVGELAALAGIGPGKASRLVAAVELGRRAVARPWPRGPRLVSSRRVHEVLAPRLVELAEERFLALALDAKHRCVAELEVARGGLTSCPVAPADVFRRLLKEAAAATVLVHNHPSGDPAPSLEDVALTTRLVEAGELLGVPVLDHVVVGREGYFSFLDMGLLPRSEDRP